MIHYVVAKRLDVSQYIVLEFPTCVSSVRALPSQSFFSFATSNSKTMQKSAEFHVKMECDRSKTMVVEALSERECLFHGSERKRRLERTTLRMLVRKVILTMQVDLQ